MAVVTSPLPSSDIILLDLISEVFKFKAPHKPTSSCTVKTHSSFGCFKVLSANMDNI